MLLNSTGAALHPAHLKLISSFFFFFLGGVWGGVGREILGVFGFPLYSHSAQRRCATYFEMAMKCGMVAVCEQSDLCRREQVLFCSSLENRTVCHQTKVAFID